MSPVALPNYFLTGGGEAGEIILAYPWCDTNLGEMESWPASLRTTLANILHSAFPSFLFWGPDLTCFYNDAYRPSLGDTGKHPAIGQPGRLVWDEIWDFIGPLINDVMASGKAKFFEDQLVPIYRNGRKEEVYWTFSYSPAFGDSGHIEGVLVTCMETTGAVLARQNIEETVRERTDDLARANKSLQDSYAYLQNITNSSREAVQILSPVMENNKVVDFTFSLTNAAYASYANTTPEALHGKRVGEVFPGYFATSSFSKVVEVYESGEPHRWDIHYDQDGLDLHNVMYAERLGDEIVLHFTDVTELKNLQLDLEGKVAALNNSNSRLEEFAHAASHDLKEPIRKVIMFIGQLRQKLADRMLPAESDLVDRIVSSSSRMSELVDDLLQYSELSARPRLKKSVNLDDVLRAVLQDLELQIEEKNATVRVGDLPKVMGYPRQLQQLFQNLISNSLKYAKASEPPIITVTNGQQHGNTGRYHEIRISDNGIGFEQQYAEKIFQMFARLHGRNAYTGTGIGLSLVRKVAENHNGSIIAESVPGTGTTFILRLPVD